MISYDKYVTVNQSFDKIESINNIQFKSHVNKIIKNFQTGIYDYTSLQSKCRSTILNNCSLPNIIKLPLSISLKNYILNCVEIKLIKFNNCFDITIISKKLRCTITCKYHDTLISGITVYYMKYKFELYKSDKYIKFHTSNNYVHFNDNKYTCCLDLFNDCHTRDYKISIFIIENIIKISFEFDLKYSHAKHKLEIIGYI